MFCGISAVYFRVIISSGVFRLGVSGEARFLPDVQTIRRFGNFISKGGNLITLMFGFDFCVNRKIIGLWSVKRIWWMKLSLQINFELV